MMDKDTTTQTVNGSVLRWVDTVLGATPPPSPAARRPGDLATKTSANLNNAIIVFAKSCMTPGDGGGGIFFWDANGGTNNGGTIIVPTIRGHK
jgi:hypothetical protein